MNPCDVYIIAPISKLTCDDDNFLGTMFLNCMRLLIELWKNIKQK